MASELSDFSSSEIYSNQDFVDFLLNDFVTLKKFDDCLKVLFFFYLKVLFESTFESFYHVEKCEHDDYSQCFFTKNLRSDISKNKVNLVGCNVLKKAKGCARLKCIFWFLLLFIS